MRVHALTVGRNEQDRYLHDALRINKDATDTFSFYDDQSDDDTLDIAMSIVGSCYRRDDGTPSFLEHEGRFRQDAYNWLERHVTPEPGDWIISVDCDEIICTTDGSRPWDAIRAAINTAPPTATAIMVPIPECFGVDMDTGKPLLRTDGWWGKIRGTRLFKWQPGGEFADKPMGSGSEPSYAIKGPFGDAGPLRIMHLGYARSEDVQAKYRRYNAMAHGHSDKHIQSIIATPTLQVWEGDWYVPILRNPVG